MSKLTDLIGQSMVRDINELPPGHLSSVVSLQLSCPALAGATIPNQCPGQPDYDAGQYDAVHPDYDPGQGVRNSRPGHSADCSQRKRIFLWSTSPGEVPQKIIFWIGNNCHNDSGCHARPCRSWRAPASWAMGQRTAKPSRCGHFQVCLSLPTIDCISVVCCQMFLTIASGLEMPSMWQKLDQTDFASLRS